MGRLRLFLIGLLVWLLFFFNIERASETINLASFVYVFTAGAAILLLLLPFLHRIALSWVFLLAFIPFFALKIAFGYEIAGGNVPITVTEICMLGGTIILARQIGRDLEDLREEIFRLTISHLQNGPSAFELGQAQIYREIRRARQFHRPAALLAITAGGESIELSMHRFFLEAQNNIIRRYIQAQIAKLLREKLKDCDVITQRNNHFVTLLPETSRQEALEIAAQLEGIAKKQLDLNLKIGISTFPDEAVTFEMLLEQAESEMQAVEQSGKENGIPVTEGSIQVQSQR